MMIKNYEDWASMDDLYMLLHTYVSDKLLKQLFDAGKKAGIESEKEKHRWIPVTERLPEDDEQILTKSRDGSILMMFYYKKQFCLYIDGQNCCANDIIVWQPLPEA
jgi:hypothetical protein